MLAAAYPDDDERGTAIGIAMGTTALGVLGIYQCAKVERGWLGRKGGISFHHLTPSPYSLFFALSHSFRHVRKHLEKEGKLLLRRLY